LKIIHARSVVRERRSESRQMGQKHVILYRLQTKSDYYWVNKVMTYTAIFFMSSLGFL